MSRSTDYVIDLERVENFAHTARPRELGDGASPVNNESGNYFSDLLVLKQNAQIPELKVLYDRLSDPSRRPLDPDERRTQFRMLMPKLELVSKRLFETVPPYNPVFVEEFGNPSPELRSFLASISSLDFHKTEPASAVALAALDLLDPAKTNQNIKTNIEDNLRNLRTGALGQSNLDIPRNGIRVRLRDEVLEFRDSVAFSEWGLAHGLTEEQVGFTNHFASQAILYSGPIFPITKHLDKNLPYNSGLNGNINDPTLTLDISEGGRVSVYCQKRISARHRDELEFEIKDAAIATYSTDISALNGTEFIPGLTSSPVSFDTRITTPDISEFRILVPDAILAATEPARTSNLDLFARNKIRGAYKTEEIASLFEERLPILREPLARLRSEDPRFRDDTSIFTSSSLALERDLAKIKADIIISDNVIKEARLEEIATLRKSLLNIFDNVREPLAKEGLLTMRDGVFQSTIATRPGLVEAFIQKEVAQISTLSEAIGAIKFAPEEMRELYIQRTGLREPRRFAAFCERAVTTEVTNDRELSHDKIRDICKKLTEINYITDPARSSPELPSRQIFPESFVRKIASEKAIPVTGSILSAASLVGGIAQGLNYVDGSDPKAILLGDTKLFTRKLRELGSGALTGVGYRGAGSTTPPLPDSVSPAGGAASSARTSPGGAAAGVSTPPPATEASPGGIFSRVATRVGSLFGKRTPSPEAGSLGDAYAASASAASPSAARIDGSASSFAPPQEVRREEETHSLDELRALAEELGARRGSPEALPPSDRLAAGSSARALQTGIPETRPRAGSSSAELAQLAASAPSPDRHPSEDHASASPAAAAAGAVKASLESPRGRGRSSAFSEGSDSPELPSRAASPEAESFRAAYPPRASRGPSAERRRGSSAGSGRGGV